jgi:uncharacterized repeat protein (TIGR02543 family)
MTKVTGPDDTYNNTATISIEGRPDYNTNTTYHKLQENNDPEVITGDPANIQQNRATIVDNTYSGIPGTIGFVAVQYSTSPAMTGPTTVRAASVTNPYYIDLTGLAPGTTYYYRAGVNSTDGNYFGAVKFFTTPAPAQSVITGDPANVATNSAKIINNSYSGITGNINFVAVQYSTSQAMTNPVTVRAASVTNPYSIDLMGLTPDTTYYYRAGVGAASGNHFGEVKSFTTDAPAFDVRYLANGGAGEYADPDQSSKLPYIVKGLSDTGISFETHSFDGWNTKADGSGIAFGPGNSIMLTGDLVLYAQWTPYARIVYDPGTYGLGGDIDYAPVGEPYRIRTTSWANVSFDPPAAYITGWFLSWNTEKDGYDEDTGTNFAPGSLMMLTGDLTLYAQWYFGE